MTLTFPWIKEGQLEDVKECLVCLEQTGECLPDEMVVNDWGLLHLLWRWKQQTQNKIRINLGILLGRPKKDTRCRYLKTEAACFRKTNLNSDFYQEYLKEISDLRGMKWKRADTSLQSLKGNIVFIYHFFRPTQHSFVHYMQNSYTEIGEDRRL